MSAQDALFPGLVIHRISPFIAKFPAGSIQDYDIEEPQREFLRNEHRGDEGCATVVTLSSHRFFNALILCCEDLPVERGVVLRTVRRGS
jgi:hypothetical protein